MRNPLWFSLLWFGAMLGGVSAMAEAPRVMTDMPVVQSLVAQVMGDVGAPQILLEQGADVHDFQLRPSQARALSEADLLFWVGPELTPWLERALGGIGIKGASVGLLHGPDVALIAAAPHDHNDPAEPEPDDHAAVDPHAWLDPGTARVWVGVIAAELALADPANAALYATNAAATLAAIDALDAEIRSILAPASKMPIVVYHDAYRYFARSYAVNIIGEIELGDASAPSAARLSDIRAGLLAGDAVCIFPEAQHDPKLLDAVLEGTTVKRGAPLDPEGTTLTYGPGLYRDLMTGLARSIADCVAR